MTEQINGLSRDIKFLVVDDITTRREELKLILNSITANIMEAENGAMAVLVANEFKPDVVFMDINMPSMDGITACRKIMETYPVPIIFLTAGADDIDDFDKYMKELRGSGAFSYIMKPARKSEVLAQAIFAIENFKKVVDLKKENENLKQYIDDRKIIGKAKNIVIERDNITEQEAHKKLQKLSMTSGKPLVEIAKALILTYTK